MPRHGEVDLTYPDKLRDIGIELQEPFQGAKVHHEMKCMSCSHVWSATPLSKLQNYKKWGMGGCPHCTSVQQMEKKKHTRTINMDKLSSRGLHVLSEWDGTTGEGREGTPIRVTVRNTKCGHVFTATSKNLLSRGVNCPVCAREYKNSALVASSKSRSEEWQKTASDWKLYKSTVTKLTRLSYNQHKHIVNPNNLPIGKAGVPGAHHVDHIVPIRYCYNNHIPAEVCAHHTNLQMLGWRENVGSRDKLKNHVPVIFEEYIK